MTALQVDSNGNRIKTDILTAGYVRQEVENKHKVVIPKEIKGLCFEFWFIDYCDEWDANYNEDNVEFKGQIAKLIKNSVTTIYGSNVNVNQQNEYEWKLALKMEDTNKYRVETYIGIIEDETEYLTDNFKTFNYDLDDQGCWLCTDGYFSNKGKEKRIIEPIDPSKQDKVEIGIKIDLNTKQIYYSIDENDYILAPYTLKHNKYRLAVTLTSIDVQVELL